MITPAAGGNRFYSLPDEGELVVCLLDARGEGGCVIGADCRCRRQRRPQPAAICGCAALKTARHTHNRKSGDVVVNKGHGND